MAYILHVDGDNFFAACLIANNPAYKGKPLVVGKERGMAVALSPEAKALGITRGMPVFQIQLHFPDAIILAGDYKLFLEYLALYSILKRYTNSVEHYSVDECFADITAYCRKTGTLPRTLGLEIQQVVQSELGIPVSIGIASTKTLAKLFSTQSKPLGFAEEISLTHTKEILSKNSRRKNLGIGPQTAKRLRVFGIYSALELRNASLPHSYFGKPVQAIQHELQGIAMIPLESASAPLQTMLSSHSFPITTNHDFLLSELKNHLFTLTSRLQQKDLCAKKIQLFTKDNKGYITEKVLTLPSSTNDLPEILSYTEPSLLALSSPIHPVRSTGITMQGITGTSTLQQSLFPDPPTSNKAFHEIINSLSKNKSAILPATYFLRSHL